MNDAGAAAGLWKRPGVAGALLVAVLVLALALRLKGVGWGLPFSFVNADESVVVPKAFGVARGGLNPQFFYYPSLFFYLVGGLYLLAAPVLWAVQHVNPLAMGSFVVDPGPYFLLARLFSVAAGTASVYLLYRIGREAFGRPAGLVAALFLAVAPLHVAYSHMAVTDVTATALSLLAFLLLLQAARGGGRRRLIAGAVAAGLATSTKYNLGALVLPATVAAVYACRGEVGRRVAAGGRAALLWPRLLLARVYAPMLVAFLVGSPFVVLDPGHFLQRLPASEPHHGPRLAGLRARRQRLLVQPRGEPRRRRSASCSSCWPSPVWRGRSGATRRVDLLLAPYALVVLRLHQHLEGARRPLPAAHPPAAAAARRAPVSRARRPAAGGPALRRAGRRARPRRRHRGAAGRLDRLRPRALRRGRARARQGVGRGPRAGRQRHRHRELRPAARATSATRSTTGAPGSRRLPIASCRSGCRRPAYRRQPRPRLAARRRMPTT